MHAHRFQRKNNENTLSLIIFPGAQPTHTCNNHAKKVTYCFGLAYLHEIVKLCEHSKHQACQRNISPGQIIIRHETMLVNQTIYVH